MNVRNSSIMNKFTNPSSLLKAICAVALVPTVHAGCRAIPGDDSWPSSSQWDNLNTTVSGRLIQTVPQASVCHTTPFADFDKTTCDSYQKGWTTAQIFVEKPAEFMNGYFQNQTCDPFTNTSTPCTLGNYAAYSIAVSGKEDIIAAVNFSREQNVRLVVKSTGHDFNGKSTGKGALSLWMFNLKTTEVIDQYESDSYNGPAMKIGSGVVGGEALQAASDAGYRIVSGECASVSLTGGYSQGGGHSMLNSAYGLAADNVLEWEVVTAAGEYLVATPEQNSDLYWALSGGGGGTYGVVLSSTVRVHPDGPIASAELIFGFNDTSAKDNYWMAIEKWFSNLPTFVNNNNSMLLDITNNSFTVLGFTLPDQQISDVDDLMNPFLDELKTLNITYTYKTNVSDNYVDYFNSILGPLPYGPFPATEIWNSRLIPKSTVTDETANGNLINAFRQVVDDGIFNIGCNVVNVADSEHPPNAVLPAWRKAIALCNVETYWNFTLPLDTNLGFKKQLSEVYTPLVEAATPDSGVYLNEMDPWYEGSWKQEMYGDGYSQLLDTKHKFDPDQLLYGHFAVGSDEFSIDGSGRLCTADSYSY